MQLVKEKRFRLYICWQDEEECVKGLLHNFPFIKGYVQRLSLQQKPLNYEGEGGRSWILKGELLCLPWTLC
jgi:hypothetical protein